MKAQFFKIAIPRIQDNTFNKRIALLKQQKYQLKQKIDAYKKLVTEASSLLERKYREKDNLVKLVPKSTGHELLVTNKKIAQYECDIKALTRLIATEKSADKIYAYEMRFNQINEKIKHLAQ